MFDVLLFFQIPLKRRLTNIGIHTDFIICVDSGPPLNINWLLISTWIKRLYYCYVQTWITNWYSKCFKIGSIPLMPNMVKVQFQNSPSHIDRLHQILAFAHTRTHIFSLMVNIFPTHTKNVVLQDIFKNRCNIKIAPRLLLMMMLLWCCYEVM